MKKENQHRRMSQIGCWTHKVILSCSNKAFGESKGVQYAKKMVIEWVNPHDKQWKRDFFKQKWEYKNKGHEKKYQRYRKVPSCFFVSDFNYLAYTSVRIT